MKVSYREIALSIVFIAIVFVFTYIIYFYIPATEGYFNIGESGVYLAALIGGPIVGAIAGGIGSALADIALGAGIYAPGTLGIKALEGFIVGYSYRFSSKIPKKGRYVIVTIISLFLIGLLTIAGILGAQGGIMILGTEYTFEVPLWIMILLGIVLSASIAYFGLTKEEQGTMILSCVLGGIFMVLGYFLYEAFVLGYGVMAAAVEIPWNIGQLAVGTAIAVPVVDKLREMGLHVSLFESEREIRE